MTKQIFFFFLLIGFSLLNPCQSEAKRIALVIGNNDYINVSKLKKAVNDARAVSRTLDSIGFKVIEKVNADRRSFDQQLNHLSILIEEGDEVLFFFAGHGISIKGRNYLLPLDIPKIIPGQERSITKEAFSEDEIISLLQERGARVKFLIIDACRNNPFPKKGTRSVGRSVGLEERKTPPRNTFIIYSAGFGEEALDRLSDDDEDPNSIFTRKLLPLLKTPGLSHLKMIKQLQIEVEQLALTTTSKHKQFPAFYDQVRGDFYLIPKHREFEEKNKAVKNDIEETLWTTIQNSKKSSDFKFYLSKFPTGKYSVLAELKLQNLSVLTLQNSLNIQSFIEDVYLREQAKFTEVVNYNELGFVNRSEIRKRIKKYKKKWPVRNYTLIPGSLKTTNSSNNEIIVVFRFNFYVSRINKNVEGTGRIKLTLIPQNNSYLVKSVKEINEIDR
jgi:hypothetical protein